MLFELPAISSDISGSDISMLYDGPATGELGSKIGELFSHSLLGTCICLDPGSGELHVRELSGISILQHRADTHDITAGVASFGALKRRQLMSV